MYSKKIDVLVVTSILPVQEIRHKQDENDIILTTEQQIRKRYDNIDFGYFFCIPWANRILSLISEKWKSYYLLKKKQTTQTKYDIKVKIISVLQVPRLRGYLEYLLFLCSWQMLNKEVDKLIREKKPNVIHAHNLRSNGMLARAIGRKYNIPYVVTARVDNIKELSFAEKVVLKDARTIIGLTPSHKRKLPAQYRDKLKMIPHGVSDVFFENAVNESVNKPIRLITIARLLPYKNIKEVILALAKIDADFLYEIYGQGPQQIELRTLISELNLEQRVFLRGFLEHNQLQKKLRNAHLFILPSFPETFGRVYIEAMASGTPIVACRYTGMDGLIVDGKEGFLLDSPDSSNIQVLLESLFRQPHHIESMRQSALATAERFRWKNIAKDLYELYNNAVSI